MCNKVSYPSREEARQDAKIIMAHCGHFRNHLTRGKTKLRPYQCPRCDAWHLTSQKQKRKVRHANS